MNESPVTIMLSIADLRLAVTRRASDVRDDTVADLYLAVLAIGDVLALDLRLVKTVTPRPNGHNVWVYGLAVVQDDELTRITTPENQNAGELLERLDLIVDLLSITAQFKGHLSLTPEALFVNHQPTPMAALKRR